MDRRKLLSLSLLFLALTACSVLGPSEEQVVQTLDSLVQERIAITQTQAALQTDAAPTLTASPSPTPTEDPRTASLSAVIYAADPYAPVLIYHQFSDPLLAQGYDQRKPRPSDFRAHLEALYESGYSLVPLADWLAGNMAVPDGRRPLIMTMDDLFFNNQITLTDEGVPDEDTGIGVLWQFTQEHPDFGFSIALFPNFGDKLYAGGLEDPDWEQKLADAVIWCLEHGALVYNHFWQHPRLDQTSPSGVVYQAERNDLYLRDLLTEAGREDLIPLLGNILALPYGVWPTPAGRELMLAYRTPEDIPVQAVLEADLFNGENILPPVYSPEFNPLNVPRIDVRQPAIDYLVENADQFPAGGACDLGMHIPEDLEHNDYLIEQVRSAVESGACPEGIYYLHGHTFRAQDGQVILLWP